MNYYLLALRDIFKSWFFLIAAILDVLGLFLAIFNKLQLHPAIYVGILVIGALLASVTLVAEKIRLLDRSMPEVISNDNLSLGGPNLSIDSISLRNIGGSVAKVTNITSDKSGKMRIIDDHYMETFILEANVPPLSIMINENKIIDGMALDNGSRPSVSTSLANDWKEPFAIYVWYEPLSGNNGCCTRIRFQSGERFVRNLGWEIMKTS